MLLPAFFFIIIIIIMIDVFVTTSSIESGSKADLLLVFTFNRFMNSFRLK